MENNIYSTYELLEHNTVLENFTQDWSVNCLDLEEMSKKYNTTISLVKKYAYKHNIKRPADFTKNKRKQTNLKKYGTEYPSQNDNVKNKRKETNIEKYGCENVFANNDIKNKIKQTMINKYGVEHPLQNEDIKNNVKNIFLKKYGVSNPFQDEEVKAKIQNIIQEKYGVMYACQAEFCKNASNGMHSKPNDNFAKELDANGIDYTREYPIERFSYDFRIIIHGDENEI